MSMLVETITFLIIVGILGALFWRLLCHWIVVPWPYFLAWFLENPYMKFFAHPSALVRFIAPPPHALVLDIGCGNGRISFPLARTLNPTGLVIGIDFQHNMIRLATKKQKRRQNFGTRYLGAPCFFMQGDIRRLSFRDPPGFDLITLTTVIGEIPQYDRLIDNFFIWLKPGGCVVVQEVIPDACYQPYEKLKKVFLRCGFVVDKVQRNALSYAVSFKKP